MLFIHRLSQEVAIEARPLATEDIADEPSNYDADASSDPDYVVYRLSGAFFFGAAAAAAATPDRITDRHKAFILDFSAVPFLDSTAANIVEQAARKAERRGIRFYVSGTTPAIRRMLLTHGVRPPHVEYTATIADAREALLASLPTD